MVDIMIPSEVYASLASQLDAAAHGAVFKGNDSCHVDLDAEFPMANGDTLFANLKGGVLYRRGRGFVPRGHVYGDFADLPQLVGIRYKRLRRRFG